jgi:ubiquitin C-terminal hydrolase
MFELIDNKFSMTDAMQYRDLELSTISDIPPFGLDNKNNYCWINSVIQCLLSCPILVQRIKEKERGNSLIKVFRDFIIIALNYPGHEVLKTMSEEAIKAVRIICKSNDFEGILDHTNRQESAQHAINVIIGKLFDDLRLRNTCYHKYKYIVKCGSCNNKSDIIDDLVICGEMRTGKHFANVSDFINHFHRKREMIPGYRCDNCKNTNTGIKISNLTSVREVIILDIHPGIDSDDIGKPRDDIPMTLTIPSRYRTRYVYDLCAIIDHHGFITRTSSGGHFSARVKRGNQWYSINDAHIIQINDESVMDMSKACVLFYCLTRID